MISIQTDKRDLNRFVGRMGRLRETRPLMEDIGTYMVGSTQRKIKEGIQPENAPLTKAYKKGGLTLRDTGKFTASVTYKAETQRVMVGTNAVQGALQQKGGTIKPRKAKHLYIPAGWKTRQLMRKFGATPRACIAGMKAAGYKVFTPKGKKAVMAQQGKGAPFVLFILKDSVDVPAREFLTVDDMDEQIIMERGVKWLKKTL